MRMHALYIEPKERKKEPEERKPQKGPVWDGIHSRAYKKRECRGRPPSASLLPGWAGGEENEDEESLEKVLRSCCVPRDYGTLHTRAC